MICHRFPILSQYFPYYPNIFPILSHIIPYYPNIFPILSHIIPYYPNIFPILSHIIPLKYDPSFVIVFPYFPHIMPMKMAIDIRENPTQHPLPASVSYRSAGVIDLSIKEMSISCVYVCMHRHVYMYVRMYCMYCMQCMCCMYCMYCMWCSVMCVCM